MIPDNIIRELKVAIKRKDEELRRKDEIIESLQHEVKRLRSDRENSSS
jgi:hypothetical protein